MLTHHLRSHRSRALLAAAVFAVAFAMSAPAAQDVGPLLFPRVPQPDSPREPEAAGLLLPDARFSTTHAWECRGDAELVRRHGAEEVDLLLRLAAALELAQADRARLLEARAGLREAARQATGQAADGSPGTHDPLLVVQEAWDVLERRLRAGWQEALGACSAGDGATELVAATRDLARIMEAADDLAVAVQGSARELLSQRLFGLALDRERGGPLPAVLRRLATAHDEVETAEAAWLDHAATISSLAGRHRRFRGWAAAVVSESLQEIEELLREERGATNDLVADALAAAKLRAREYAARHHPAFLAASRSVLDTGGLHAESPRRVAAEAVIDLLRRQLPLLADLYLARRERTTILAPHAEASPRELAEQELREPLEHAWHRISRVVELLGQGDLSDLERGWAWTEIGRMRDRALVLERLDLSMAEQDGTWSDGAGVVATTAYREVVAEEVRLIDEIDVLKRAESPHLVALDRYGERVARSAASALETVIAAADGELAATSGPGPRRAIAALRGQSAGRLAAVRAGLETGASASEPIEVLRSAAADVALPFAQAADGLRAVVDLERIVENAPAAVSRLQQLRELRDVDEVDRAVVEIGLQLDLALRPEISSTEVRVVLVGGIVEYAVPCPLPASFVRPAAFAHGRATRHPSLDGLLHVRGDEELPWERPRTTPPEWERSIGERLIAVPVSIGDEVMGSGWVYVTAATVALLPIPDPIFKTAAAQVIRATLAKDLMAGTVKGLGEAIATDPRTIANWKRAVSWGRLSSDLADIKGGFSSWRNAPMAKKAGEAMQLGGGIADTFKGTAQTAFPSDDDPFPYEQNIRDASDLISQALSIAKICEPADWTVIRGLVDQAADRDPHRQADAWNQIGRTLMELAYTCPDKLAPYGGSDPLETALDALEEQIRACRPHTARAKLSQCRSPHYTALKRCLCRHDFRQDLGLAEVSIDQLERGLGLLEEAEASCTPAVAGATAQRVLDWTDANGGLFDCTESMRGRAAEIARWAQQAGSIDAGAVLAEAESEIGACRPEAALELLTAVSAPRRCAADLSSQQDEARRQDLVSSATRLQEHNERLLTLQSEARAAFERCDMGGARDLLSQLESLEPCIEGKAALADDLRTFAEHGTIDDREVETIDGYAAEAITTCNFDLAGRLVDQLQPLKPCLEANQSRRAELAERLRLFVERGYDTALGDDALAQAQEAFNSAVHGASYDCDMTGPRRDLERARELLLALQEVECVVPNPADFQMLVMHGSFVEETINERDALMGAIRGAAEAAESAFTYALQACDPSALRHAASRAMEVVRLAGPIPFMTGAGCQEINALVADAGELQSEATTLTSYWEDVDTDLASARRAAADGDQVGIDRYCAGVRQKAQPSRCFAGALAECGGLVPAAVPTGSSATSPVGTTSASSPSASGSTSPSGGSGSGRVQILGTDPCAADMSWNPSREGFECTCPGYRLDPELGRCVPAGSHPAGLTQADCTASRPGTVLGPDPRTGQPACRCPNQGEAWSDVQGRCLSLIPDAASIGSSDCSHITGAIFDDATGRCRCVVGTMQGGRCVDTAAAERDEQIAQARQGADCVRLYSEIRVSGSNTDPLQQQMAARAIQEAYRTGCDPGRINEAIAAARANPWSQTGSGAGGGAGTGTGGSSGREGAPGGRSDAGAGEGDSAGGGQERPGTCRIIRHAKEGDVFLVYEQHVAGNHHNVFLIPVWEEDEAALRAHWDSMPGDFRLVGRFTSSAAADVEVERICAGKQRV